MSLDTWNASHRGRPCLCASADIDDWPSQRADASREQEANQFAAALLLPERFFKPLCQKKEPSLDLMADLADSFDVSLTATALRYLQFCNEACAVVFSRDGIIQWFRGSKYFDELRVFIPVARRLIDQALPPHFSRVIAFERPGRASMHPPGSRRDGIIPMQPSMNNRGRCPAIMQC
jgi:hypothetical protein